VPSPLVTQKARRVFHLIAKGLLNYSLVCDKQNHELAEVSMVVPEDGVPVC
jgi:hypothetical protein